MLVCDICTQEVLSEDDMKSHLLLTHMEQDACCPFCTIAGITYDELHYHIQLAHGEALEASCSDEEDPKENRNPPSSLANISDHSQTKEFEPGNHIKPSSNKNVMLFNIKSDTSKIEGSLNAEDIISDSSSSTSLSCNTESDGVSLISVESGLSNSGFEQDLFNEISASAPQIACAGDIFLECPFCAEVKTAIEELERHVRMEHADLVETPTKGNSIQEFECPMCSLRCTNGHLLQEHVNLHLEEAGCNEAKVSNDSLLARQLQDEEYKRKRTEESEKEQEEFKKLQRQFGLDNSGGYRQQSVQNLERAVSRGRMQPMEFHRNKAQMMESLATGIDDGRTKTSGVLGALHHYYETAPEVRRVWLCSPLDHYSNSSGDKGWGCGFRNFQMMLSSILLCDSYRNSLQDYRHIPCIPKIQALIEEAWKEGFDPQGASHFNGKLQGTKAWIGASEIYCLLTFLHIKCRILDFHKPSSPSGTHPLLFEWVQKYYASDVNETVGKVVWSPRPAIYLQHQGHSRTIVGIEERKNNSYCLLIFDPGCPSEIMHRLTQRHIDSTALKHLRKHPGSLKHKQYQIVAAEGALLPEEKAVRLQMTKIFRSERIP